MTRVDPNLMYRWRTAALHHNHLPYNHPWDWKCPRTGVTPGIRQDADCWRSVPLRVPPPVRPPAVATASSSTVAARPGPIRSSGSVELIRAWAGLSTLSSVVDGVSGGGSSCRSSEFCWLWVCSWRRAPAPLELLLFCLLCDCCACSVEHSSITPSVPQHVVPSSQVPRDGTLEARFRTWKLKLRLIELCCIDVWSP